MRGNVCVTVLTVAIEMPNCARVGEPVRTLIYNNLTSMSPPGDSSHQSLEIRFSAKFY